MTEEVSEKKSNGRARFLIPIGIVVVLCLAYGVYWLIALRGTAYTDDARIKTLLVPCSSRVGGRAMEVLVQGGDDVAEGQVLARLDDMPYRALRDEAKANLEAAEAALDQARLNLRKARISVTKELAIAKAEVTAASAKQRLSEKQRERFQNLGDNATREQVDTVGAAYSGAEAGLAIAKEKLGFITAGTGGGDTVAPRELDLMMLENAVEMAKSKVDLARSALDMAEDNLAEVEVKAPAAGRVSRRYIDPGQVVGPGQRIFSISVLASPWIEANFEEKDIADISPGDPAKVEVDAYPGRAFKGKVVSVLGATLSEFSVLSSGASSGSYVKVAQRVPVRIELTDPDLPPLYPGLNVEVRVKLGGGPARAASPDREPTR